MMATSPIPEGAEDNIIDYYDIMVIGRTGMGKSTTADKLVIANPDGHDYRGEQHVDEIVNEGQVKMSDLTMWRIADVEDEVERVTVRLKNLVMFRSLDSTHKEVNNLYRRAKKPTIGSQIVSNETTRVRILDVPGFFGNDIGTAEASSTGNRVTLSGLLIMREVLRIQATMRMKFRRIIYFIPERGPLERPHKVLLMELEQMVHYFGKSIFECMVLVATVSPDVYQFLPENIIPFTNESEATTRRMFAEALTRVLPNNEHLPDGKPPIVFISMHDTCETILAKIKEAPVIRGEFKLAFDHRTCVRCGLKAKILKYKNDREKRVACYAGEDPTVGVAYEESHCHPLIISKYWKITKIVGGIAHFITRNQYEGKWPDFRNRDDEVCIACGRIPGEPGCKKIGSRYRLEGVVLRVDHSPTEPVVIAEGEDPGQIAIQVDVDDYDEHRPQDQPPEGVAVNVQPDANNLQEQSQGGARQVQDDHEPPVIRGEQSQPQPIVVQVEHHEPPQVEVGTPVVVGTPDWKG